jgi:hypothetical protein
MKEVFIVLIMHKKFSTPVTMYHATVRDTGEILTFSYYDAALQWIRDSLETDNVSGLMYKIEKFYTS